MNREKLEKIIEESLHIDWAFKDVHGKPDKIIIEGYPKGAYHIGYDEFVKRISQAFKSYMAEVIVTIGQRLETDKGKEYRFYVEKVVNKYYGLSTYKGAGLSQPATRHGEEGGE